jgi:hypothetical protein
MLCRALRRRAGADNGAMQAVPPWLSLIVPVLDEGPALESALQALVSRPGVELIVVDGGSSDASLALAQQWADLALSAPRGRAVQMNAGAAVARGQWLLFVHADTRLPAQAWQELEQLPAGSLWGRFDVRIDDPRWLLALVGFMMNLRSRLSGIATGDQAMFVRREVFEQLGEFTGEGFARGLDASMPDIGIPANDITAAGAVASGRGGIVINMGDITVTGFDGGTSREVASAVQRDVRTALMSALEGMSLA